VYWRKGGERKGDLTVLRELGRGSFARVFLATEATTGDRLVVVKFAVQGDAEARTMGRLSHSHIVPILSARVEESSGLTAVCMPYLGSATLEDVLEQILGDIGDEHDIFRPAPREEEKLLELEGSTTIRDIETRYHIALPSEAGFETLAGFLLFRFGFIPKVKDSLEYGGRRFTITQMDRNRIASVLIEKLDQN